MFLSLAGVFSSGGLANPFPEGEQGIFLDASDTSTLYQDSAGTTPVTAAGQPVGRWEDKSGNAYIFHQTTSTKRPLYGTDGTLHWVDFDGVDDVMVSSINVDLSANDEISIFVGSKLDVVQGVEFSHSSSPITNQGAFLSYHSGSNYDSRLRGSLTSSVSFVDNTNTKVVSVLGKISTDSHSLYKNGALIGSSSNDQGTGNLGSYPLYFGAFGTAAGDQLNGRIYAVIIYGKLASDAQKKASEEFVAEKSGVTL